MACPDIEDDQYIQLHANAGTDKDNEDKDDNTTGVSVFVRLTRKSRTEKRETPKI